jgi:HD-GYP domain-containing protein (c-di-GMP phosphodiesterase class II)
LNKNGSLMLGPIKRTIYVVISAIFLLLVCFIYLHNRNQQREYEDKLIINTFGKQRMYTQMISKDASHLYSVLQQVKIESGDLTEAKIKTEINELKDSLAKTSAEFSSTLESLHNRSLKFNKKTIQMNDRIIYSSEYLKEIDSLWAEFDANVQVIINAEQVDDKVVYATAFINKNNMKLLELSDDLLNQILEKSLATDKRNEYIAYGLCGLLFISIVISLIQLQRYLILPFSNLYKGIAEIGLDYDQLGNKLPTKKEVTPIVTEIGDIFKKINYLISLIENINNNASFMDTLQFINRTFSLFIPYNYIGISLIDENKELLRASYGVSDGSIIGLPEKVIGSTWPIKETSLGSLLTNGKSRIINDLEQYCAGRPLKPYNKVMLDAGIRASITLPLIVSGEPVGMIFFSSRNKNVYNEKHEKILRTLANSIAISLNQNIFINDILYTSILALAKLAEARDEDTGEHMDRMSKYSKAIAQMLYENDRYTDEITVDYIDNIERFSPLHDIGKVGILDGILLKPGKLTPQEFNEMKKHTMFGAEVLKSAELNMQKKGRSLFRMGIEIAEGHHEKWDGSGYPYGKKGNEIPLCARIVAVADVFDALTSKRPYKQAFPFELSVKIIEEGRGKHFDPVIVDAFLANRNIIEKLYFDFKTTDEEEALGAV